MKKTAGKRLGTGIATFALIFSLVPARVYAAGETAYLTPASGTTKPGDTFIVSVDGFVGSSIFGTYSVQGSLTFPKNLLNVVSIDSSGASFKEFSTITPDNSAGTITFNQSNWFRGANSQNVHLFKVTFQSLAAGTANVKFGKVTYNTGTAGTTGGVYAIKTPPPPSPSPTPKPSKKPTPKHTPKPSNSPKPVPITSPTNKPVPTPSYEPIQDPDESDEEEGEDEIVVTTGDSDGGLAIKDVHVTANREENYVTWTLNNDEAEPTVSYGLDKNDQDTEGTVAKQEDGTYRVDFTNLELGTLYYFTIKASTPDELQGATFDGTITTRGYPVQLTVKLNNLLLPGARITIDGRSFTANKDAIVLTELADGQHTAIITPSESTQPFEVTFAVANKEIPASGNPDLQSFVLNAAAEGKAGGLKSSLLMPIIAAVTLLISLGAIITFIVIRRRRIKMTYASTQGDADLLQSSYGDLLSQRSNTPPPQLTTPVVAPPPTDSYSPENMAYSENIQDNETYPTETSNLPLPPAATESAVDTPPQEEITTAYATTPDVQYPESPQPEVQAATLDEVPNEIQPVAEYPEEGQLTGDAVETEHAQEQPEAFYDSVKGELDIIHHGGQADASPPDTAERVESTEITTNENSLDIEHSEHKEETREKLQPPFTPNTPPMAITQ